MILFKYYNRPVCWVLVGGIENKIKKRDTSMTHHKQYFAVFVIAGHQLVLFAYHP